MLTSISGLEICIKGCIYPSKMLGSGPKPKVGRKPEHSAFWSKRYRFIVNGHPPPPPPHTHTPLKANTT